MTSRLRVLVEEPTRGKRWVAVAADWPGLERGAKTEDEAVEKLARYVPRYLPVAKRVRLGSELAAQTDPEIIGRYPGVGSTDFWGISFAPSPLDREPFDYPERGKITEHRGDIRNRSHVDKAVAGCDVVVHAAAALPPQSATPELLREQVLALRGDWR